MRRWSVVLLMLVALQVKALAQPREAAQITGEYCYTYGDSESLVTAKEISYAVALRHAIETYKTFVSSTSIVKDLKLRKDLVETIASGYVDNIRVVKQEAHGRTVCTKLVGRVNPGSVKSIISRKVTKANRAKQRQFEGIISIA